MRRTLWDTTEYIQHLICCVKFPISLPIVFWVSKIPSGKIPQLFTFVFAGLIINVRPSAYYSENYFIRSDVLNINFLERLEKLTSWRWRHEIIRNLWIAFRENGFIWIFLPNKRKSFEIFIDSTSYQQKNSDDVN